MPYRGATLIGETCSPTQPYGESSCLPDTRLLITGETPALPTLPRHFGAQLTEPFRASVRPGFHHLRLALIGFERAYSFRSSLDLLFT